MNDVEVRQANLDDASDAAAVLQMTRAYSLDPMGWGKDLPSDVQESLIERMRSHPTIVSFLAWDGDTPVGIATCVLSFATFRARPVLNLHDLAVTGEHRGKRIASLLMQAVEDYARSQDCVVLTLEVYGGNHHARDVYHALGFSNARETPEEDTTIFCRKML